MLKEQLTKRLPHKLIKAKKKECEISGQQSNEVLMPQKTLSPFHEVEGAMLQICIQMSLIH